MRGKVSKILILVVSLLGTVASIAFMMEISGELKKLPEATVAETTGHEAPAGAHGAPSGGHGETAKADAHGAPAGEHGAAPAAEHGAPPAGEHGAAPATDAHGNPIRTVASTGVPLVSLDEVFANISTEEVNHTLAIKLDLELFDEKYRHLIEGERVQAGIKNTIIQASREQPLGRLQSMAGKLYYKEYLVLRLNEYLHEPAIRDLHFSSFFLQ